MNKKFLIRSHEVDLFSGHRVQVEMCFFDRNYYDDAFYTDSKIRLSESIANTSLKRKSDFLAGRISANKALRKIGAEDALTDTDSQHLPRWPPGYVGSISHTDGIAVSAVSLETYCTAVGIDAELTMDLDSIHFLYKELTVENEWEVLIRQNTAIPKSTLLTLIFSAKESLYKALYPLVREFFDFQAARVESISVERREFSIVLTRAWNDTFYKGLKLVGDFRVYDGFVVTGLVII